MILVIRHARTRQDRDSPAETWPLDDSSAEELRAWAAVFDWGRVRGWYSSPEDKAVATAAALTTRPVRVVAGLREVRRGAWLDDYDATVRRLFDDADVSPAPGWEPARAAADRFDAAVREIASRHPGEDVAVVSHGLVMSLWRARLAQDRVDVDQWRALRFPDLLVLSDAGIEGWLREPPDPVQLTPLARRA